MRDHSKLNIKRLKEKLGKLSERQDGTLRTGSHNNVVPLDGVEMPKFVLDILSMTPKHRGVKKFNELLKDQKTTICAKSCGLCVMKQTTHSDKLNEILVASQFEARNRESDARAIKMEKLINSGLLELLKQGRER